MEEPLKNLSVVFPSYNEGKRIGPTLDRAVEYLSATCDRFEILVVNDGSTDDTVAVASERLSSVENARVLDNPGNRGKGYSVRHGMLEATGDWILFSDADLSTPIEEVEKLAQSAAKAQVIFGSRGLRSSEILERQPIYRETMGRIFNLMVQAIALPGIHDSQCGFKLFRKDAAHSVFSRTTIEGFGFDVEALYLARRLGWTLDEVPVRWVNDPATTVNALVDSSRMAADLFRVRFRHRGVKKSSLDNENRGAP